MDDRYNAVLPEPIQGHQRCSKGLLHFQREQEVVISCMSGSIGPVTITMFASPMIQPKLWRRFRSLMAAKAGCHLRPLPVPSRLVQIELFRIWRGVVLLLKQVVSGKRFVC